MIVSRGLHYCLGSGAVLETGRKHYDGTLSLHDNVCCYFSNDITSVIFVDDSRTKIFAFFLQVKKTNMLL